MALHERGIAHIRLQLTTHSGRLKTREWKSRHRNAGVENAREASMESDTLTTLTTQDERCTNASFFMLYT